MPHSYRAESLTQPLELETIFLALGTGSWPVFWLDSGPEAHTGSDYLGIAEIAVSGRITTGRAGVLSVLMNGVTTSRPVPDLHAAVEAELYALGGEVSPRHAGNETGFCGGWVGALGYEYGAALMGFDAHAEPAAELDVLWLLADTFVELEHASGRMRQWRRGDSTGLLERLALLPAGHSPSSAVTEPSAPRWRHDADAYRALVRASIEAIGRGELFQICLTNQLEILGEFDAYARYVLLRNASPSDHAGFLQLGSTALASASPETFITVSPGGEIATRPVKGTRRRDPEPARDRDLAREVLEDPKERAENLMIVDLMRNDLSRVARLGSVAVTELLAVETFPHVHQLVSTVTAQLHEGVDFGDVIAACFPAGSMSGAPKHRAMSLLRDFEAGARGLYAGTFGYRAISGRSELAMIIRSIIFTPGKARIGAGGGITALSQPDAELEETYLKARVLSEVLLAPGPRAEPSAPTADGLAVI